MTKQSDVSLLPFILSISIGLVFWIFSPPIGMTNEAWHMLGIFIATIVAIVSKALPMGGCALLSLAVITLTKTLTIKEALGSFSSPVIWLIVLAFFVAKSFIKTGLGIRLAYLFVSLFGKNSLGIGYGMALTDLALSPAIPSNTARAGGILFPIVKSLAITFDSHPTDQASRRKIGAYLIQSLYQCNIVTSTMFITAMAANPLIVELAGSVGIEISWGLWALAAIVPGLLSLIILPYFLYKVYPPSLKETPEAPGIARKNLVEMGPMSPQEWITLAVFLLMMTLWIIGPTVGIHSTTVAICGISLLVLTGVLSWNELTSEQSAWNTLFWFATLMMMAANLNTLGVIDWMSLQVKDTIQSIPWYYDYPLLVVTYFYIHYFFASSVAHASSLFAAFAVIGMAGGIPPMLIILALAFSSSLSSCLTHYGTAPGPILFGSGYVDLGTWWKLGAIVSILHLIIWIGLGTFWWKAIGLW